MAVVNYQVRVNGGAETDLGLVLTTVVDGLDDSGDVHTFEVRAEDDAGNFSPWSLVYETPFFISGLMLDDEAYAMFDADGFALVI